MTYHQEQCACGFVERVAEGELKPDGWFRLPGTFALVCPRCWKTYWDRREVAERVELDRSRERALGEGT